MPSSDRHAPAPRVSRAPRADPPTAPAADPSAPQHAHYFRLLEGMAKAVEARGYGEVTIADIVRAAGVSRRSFYEHFATKADCLIALYRSASEQALMVLSAAVDPVQPWETQVERAVTAYFDFLAQDPTLLKTLFVEIVGLGLPGLAIRRKINEQIAAFITQATERPDGARLSPALAMTVVGGINELLLQAVEQDRSHELRSLVEPATRMVCAVAAAR